MGKKNEEAQLASVENASTKPESQGLKAGCSAAPNRRSRLAASWNIHGRASCQGKRRAC